MDFLVDAQLPPLLSEWISHTNDHKARHVAKLKNGLTSKDSNIWNVALKYDKIIISKDFDFYERALIANPAPIILHIDLGNCTNKMLINYFETQWENIIDLLQTHHKLISCKADGIEFW
jgi:predicted nuclease of predicted toxin-antitoxin system